MPDEKGGARCDEDPLQAVSHVFQLNEREPNLAHLRRLAQDVAGGTLVACDQRAEQHEPTPGARVDEGPCETITERRLQVRCRGGVGIVHIIRSWLTTHRVRRSWPGHLPVRRGIGWHRDGHEDRQSSHGPEHRRSRPPSR